MVKEVTKVKDPTKSVYTRARTNVSFLDPSPASPASPAFGSRRSASLDTRNDGPIVMLTTSQLRELVGDAVSEALAEHEAGRSPAPELVDHAAICAMLSVSRTTLHRMRVAGIPCVRIGETYRYRPADVLRWLDEGGAAQLGAGCTSQQHDSRSSHSRPDSRSEGLETAQSVSAPKRNRGKKAGFRDEGRPNLMATDSPGPTGPKSEDTES